MAKCRYTVYNAEIFCGALDTSGSADVRVVKFKKVFLGHPNDKSVNLITK